MVPMPRTELAQSKFLCGKQAFEIVDGEMLDIKYDRFTLHQQFQIPLWEILPDPQRIRHWPVGTTAGAAIFGILLLVLVILPFFIGEVALVLVFPGLFIVSFFIACLYKLKVTSVNGLMFHLRNGGYIEVWHENPNKETFDAFCDALKRSVKQAWERHSAAVQGHTFAAEILDLKKLADSGLLSQEEYARLKERILTSDQRQIGFR